MHDSSTCLPLCIELADGLLHFLSVAKSTFKNWINAYSVPSRITTNKCSRCQFTLFLEFVNVIGVKYIRTNAYHLCANGIVKRFPR